MAKYERGTKLVITITNGVNEEKLRITADGDWVSNERQAINMAKSMINSEWSVVKVEISK